MDVEKPCGLGAEADTDLYIHAGPYCHTGLSIQQSATQQVDMHTRSKISKLTVTMQALISDHSVAHVAKY